MENCQRGVEVARHVDRLATTTKHNSLLPHGRCTYERVGRNLIVADNEIYYDIVERLRWEYDHVDNDDRILRGPGGCFILRSAVCVGDFGHCFRGE